MKTKEVHDPPVLLQAGHGAGLEGMDHVWEGHAVTEEKDWEVAPNKVIVPLFRVEFYGESPGVPQVFGGPFAVDCGGESGNDGGLVPIAL